MSRASCSKPIIATRYQLSPYIQISAFNYCPDSELCPLDAQVSKLLLFEARHVIIREMSCTTVYFYPEISFTWSGSLCTNIDHKETVTGKKDRTSPVHLHLRYNLLHNLHVANGHMHTQSSHFHCHCLQNGEHSKHSTYQCLFHFPFLSAYRPSFLEAHLHKLHYL